MVTNENKHSDTTPGKQGSEEATLLPNPINSMLPRLMRFFGKNLTPYGEVLPVVTMLEKLGFQSLVEQTMTSKRIPRGARKT